MGSCVFFFLLLRKNISKFGGSAVREIIRRSSNYSQWTGQRTPLHRTVVEGFGLYSGLRCIFDVDRAELTLRSMSLSHFCLTFPLSGDFPSKERQPAGRDAREFFVLTEHFQCPPTTLLPDEGGPSSLYSQNHRLLYSLRSVFDDCRQSSTTDDPRNGTRQKPESLLRVRICLAPSISPEPGGTFCKGHPRTVL